MVVNFIDTYRERFGVEPICRVLTEHGCGIAPSTYYAARNRPPSKRELHDRVVLEHIRRVHGDPNIGRGLYGVRKVYAELKAEQERCEHPELGPVPRRQIERLMRANGLRGVRRDKAFKTTRPDSSVVHPPDRVKRHFKASAPNKLWVVDFTYVPTWAGMVFTAFVNDVFARRICWLADQGHNGDFAPARRVGAGVMDPGTSQPTRYRPHSSQRRRVRTLGEPGPEAAGCAPLGSWCAPWPACEFRPWRTRPSDVRPVCG